MNVNEDNGEGMTFHWVQFANNLRFIYCMLFHLSAKSEVWGQDSRRTAKQLKIISVI